MSSQGIGFCAQFSRTETDNHVELGKEFQPAGLPMGKKFSSGEVFQIPVISDHIDRGSATF